MDEKTFGSQYRHKTTNIMYALDRQEGEDVGVFLPLLKYAESTKAYYENIMKNRDGEGQEIRYKFTEMELVKAARKIIKHSDALDEMGKRLEEREQLKREAEEKEQKIKELEAKLKEVNNNKNDKK